MATDIVGGITGDVTASGFNGDIDGWSASIEVDSTRYRTFASQWKKSKNVAYGMSGQFTGTIQFDSATTEPVPSSTTITDTAFEGVSLTLTATTGCTYTGTGNITGVDLQRPSTDRMTGTWKFEFDGQPSQTWDETGA